MEADDAGGAAGGDEEPVGNGLRLADASADFATSYQFFVLGSQW